MNKVCFVYYILIAVFLSPFNIFSESPIGVPPKIEVTLIIVPEIAACRPNGYSSYKSQKKSKCTSLTMEDIKGWKENMCYKYQITNIPPSEINLDSALYRNLESYCLSFIPEDASKRQSFVLVFDWRTPMESIASIERKVYKKNVGIKEKVWTYELKRQRRLIHHERADAFLPANNVKWILKAGKYSWVFKICFKEGEGEG